MSFLSSVGNAIQKFGDEAATFRAEVEALMEKYRDSYDYSDERLKEILSSTGFWAHGRKEKIAARKVLEERGVYFN